MTMPQSTGRRPPFWPAALALLVLVTLPCLDASAPPEHQVLVWVGLGAIAAYQAAGRPLLQGHVSCLYRPTCSDYGRKALGKYGFWRGTGKTLRRVLRCRAAVPVDTVDEP